MYLVTNGVTPDIVLPDAPEPSADRTQVAAERAIADVFADPDRPRLTEVGALNYSTDGLRAPINAPTGWKCGNYVTFGVYSSETKENIPFHYNVSGTGPNGEYIPPHRVDHTGRVYDSTTPPYTMNISEESTMIKLLDLKPGATSDENGNQYYTREGFSGRYYLQREEPGGKVTVFYTGGQHVSGVRLPPQTFAGGAWDLKRTQPYEAAPPPSSSLVLNLPSHRRFARA